jgi:hypothetical protein
MDIEVDFSKLKALKEEMGADEAKYPPQEMSRLDDLEDVQIGVISQIEQEDLIDGVLEIDVFKLDIQGEVFAYKGEQLVIHIYETRKELDYVKDDPQNNVRFHLTDCKTIDLMKRKNRFERYIGSQNRNGEFKVNVYIDENRKNTESIEITTRLMTCKNCLDKLNYNSYNDSIKYDKNQTWTEFNINDYFDEYNTYFQQEPLHTCATVPIDDYPENWLEISRNQREARGWTCEDCRINLSRHMNLLHTHHINHVKGDVNPYNLKVLCAVCHSQQPNHKHMSVAKDVNSLITRLRREQRISK